MAAIFCFTSTGNSLYAALRLAAENGAHVRPMNSGTVRCGDDCIGFVFPVYFWGLPRMVESFVSGLQITDKNAYVFALATRGGTVPGVPGRVKQLLKSKGVRLRYGATLTMVTNYTPEYTPEESPEKWQKIDAALAEIGAAVQNRQGKWVGPYTPANRLAYRLFPGAGSDEYFTTSPACTGCGACAQVCPANNIALQEGRPVYLHSCEHCLACLHACPQCAIDWKGKTEGKLRYKNSHVPLQELIAFNSGGPAAAADAKDTLQRKKAF